MTRLTPEQEQALTELLAHVPAKSTPVVVAPSAPPAEVTPDWLTAWTGASRSHWLSQIQRLLAQKDGLENAFLTWIERNPLDAAFEFLAVAALGFYLAEHEVNPRIKTYVDAFYYISTCASVGYADIFAMTQAGKAIASLVMTVGPALAARTLDRPRSS